MNQVTGRQNRDLLVAFDLGVRLRVSRPNLLRKVS